MVKNCAFVFIKPHAVTDKVKDLVKETFEKQGFEIKKDGEITGKEIDEKMLIDNHYYAIASKATILTPDKLNIPKDKFKETFELEWDEALKAGKCLNAKQACEKFEVDADALDGMWAAAKKAKDLVKFGGGFYCAKLTSPKDKETYYVLNGFFMTMRSKFVAESAKLYYYVVEWDSAKFTWADFRGKVLGPTDPATAPQDSLRGMILKDWKSLGLASEPNVGDNGVHASASPFEALAERMNWLGHRADRDPFGSVILKAGVTRKQLKAWVNDPQVTYGPVSITGSLFDTLEDTDSDYCAALCQLIAGECNPKGDASLEKEVAQLRAEVEKLKELEHAVNTLQKFTPTPVKSSGKGSSDGKGKGKGSSDSKSEGKGKAKGSASEDEAKPKRKRNRGGKGRNRNSGD